jgi:hypothetical protein
MESGMISLKPASAQDLYWNFARAEFEIPTHGQRHTQPTISNELRDRLLRDERSTFSERDWADLRNALLSTRSNIVRPLLEFEPVWFVGELPSTEWAALRVMNLRIFLTLAPSRRLDELTQALDQGLFPTTWNPSLYPRLRSSFDLTKMHGIPIILATQSTGPYTLVEGTTRMCALLSKKRRDELQVEKVPMLLGVSPHFIEWEWF